jgi:hypothetical protein
MSELRKINLEKVNDTSKLWILNTEANKSRLNWSENEVMELTGTLRIFTGEHD